MNLSCSSWNWAAIGALAAWAAVIGTLISLWAQMRFLKRTLSAQIFSQLNDQWDSTIMTTRRRVLAQELKANKPDQVPQAVVEDVIDFFEILGTNLRNKHLDIEPVWQAFSTVARHYWAACGKIYVTDMRVSYSDGTFYSEFEFLVSKLDKKEMEKRGVEDSSGIMVSTTAINNFLEMERSLS
jgi:hypothetical protein